MIVFLAIWYDPIRISIPHSPLQRRAAIESVTLDPWRRLVSLRGGYTGRM